jgi:glyoxylase-like metal-dependent hydrolase (beta-lactamase superfamily II)
MAGTDKIQIIYLGELGNPPILSGYLVLKNKKGALIESGPTSVVDEYIYRVKKYIEPEDLKYIFVSHIHLDHSGGSWKFVNEFPEIKVIVHEKGSKHLIDPKKLVEASKTALGKIYSYWGDPEPVPEKNIMPVGDQFFEPEFGIRIIYTPGHASHSTALYHEETGTLFPGDSAGMLLFGEGGKIWPAAPPPFF